MIVSIYEEEDELVRKAPLDEALHILRGIIEERGDNAETLCVCIFVGKSA